MELVERCAQKERKAFLNAQNEVNISTHNVLDQSRLVMYIHVSLQEGEAAMHIACRNGLMRTVKYLKRKGATKRVKNLVSNRPTRAMLLYRT